jgi:quercetin dioxygenase-like cupin family protein
MIKADLNTIELMEFTAKSVPNQRCKANFPLIGAHGTQHCASVYFELDPKEKLGKHTDSAEEMLYIINGEVEVTIGEETGTIKKGELAIVPRMIPHDLKNTGDEVARVLGFFGGANNIVATFDEIWLPTESNMVDTSLLG